MCIRCKDCQHFDGISTCENHQTLKVSKYDNCFEYEDKMKILTDKRRWVNE